MHRSRLLPLFLIGLVCSFASTAHAQVSAGFAPGPVWLSKSAAVDGDSVDVYTVVYDSSATALEGSVNFLVDGASIGATPFSLDAGASAIEHVAWKAVQGTHTFTAAVASVDDKNSKQATAVTSATTTAVTITIAAPAAPTPALAALDSLFANASSTSPLVASIGTALVDTTEGIRTAGATLLAQAAAPATSTTALPSTVASSTPANGGEVLGAETETYNGAEAAAEAAARAGKPSWTQIVAKALLPIFVYPAIFYPVFFVLIIFILWLLARHFGRPSQKRGKK